jgi:hypothetical protein
VDALDAQDWFHAGPRRAVSASFGFAALGIGLSFGLVLLYSV